MKIFRHIAGIPESCKGAVVAIGNFDGLHIGHRALIAEARRHAEERSAPLGVMVFEPPPQDFFRPGGEPFRLTPFHAKARLVASLGADVLYAFPFNAELAHLDAQDFVFEILLKGLGVGCVAVGSDFRFGSGRGGDATMLSYMGEMEGFCTVVLDTISFGAGEKISSTAIRTALREGRAEDAARLLGHPFAIEGIVAHGDHRGRTLGWPTINLNLDGYVRPAFGIYAVRASVLEGDTVMARYDGVANLGIRPMYQSAEPLLEAHLFDFSGDLYGRHVAVELISFLRPEMKFASVEELKARIAEDAARAKIELKRAQ